MAIVIRYGEPLTSVPIINHLKKAREIHWQPLEYFLEKEPGWIPALCSESLLGLSDGVFMQYDQAGILENAFRFGSSSADLPYEFKIDSCGNPRIFYSSNVQGYSFPTTGNLSTSSVLHFETFGVTGYSDNFRSLKKILYVMS